MKRTLMIVALLVGLLMMVSQANAGVRVHFGGSSRRGDTVVGVSLFFGHSPRIYRAPRIYYRPWVRPHPRSCYRPCCRPRHTPRYRRPLRRGPIYRQSTYFRYPGPGGHWVSHYGGQAYRHGPYLYVPIKSWDGVRRYRRIYVRR